MEKHRLVQNELYGEPTVHGIHYAGRYAMESCNWGLGREADLREDGWTK